MKRALWSQLQELKDLLDELEISSVVEGDTVQWVKPMTIEELRARQRGLQYYTPDGELIGEIGPETTKLVMDHRELPDSDQVDGFKREGTMVIVSTQYMGVNLDVLASFRGAPPATWETIVFAGTDINRDILGQWRYCTTAAAHAGHQAVVAVCSEWAVKP